MISRAALLLVREQIERAFEDVPYPGDEHIVSDPGWEKDVLALDFKGKHWKDISRETLRRHQDDLALFTPAGRKFYLPAYLLAALDDRGDLLGWVIIRLTLPETLMFQRMFHSDFDGYSPAQKSAIRAFLEYIRDALSSDDAAAALERYWAGA